MQYLRVVSLEEKYVVVENLDEELRVHPSGDADVSDLERPLQALQHAAGVAATGRILPGGRGGAKKRSDINGAVSTTIMHTRIG